MREPTHDKTEPLLCFSHALQLTLDAIFPLGSETVPLAQSVGRLTDRDLYSQVDSPSADVSRKDGYAVRSADIATAAAATPVRLPLAGTVGAGDGSVRLLSPGTAIKILSGAQIPAGADAVVANEFADDDGRFVTARNNAEPGRNLLRRGSDVHRGQALIAAGSCLRPAQVGLLAAAGHSEVPVIRLPRVAVLATGDEVVAPGGKLDKGDLYASNVVALAAWCRRYGMETHVDFAQDRAETIGATLLRMVDGCDAIVTSGGAWMGERDLIVHVLDEMGWRRIYHRVKIGPGKAVGLGLWHDKPVFCLPGGPPSNQMAFLQLALPGLLRLAGHAQPGLPCAAARLAAPVEGQIDWTQFVDGRFEARDGELWFHPYPMASRLVPMANSDGILCIPEGTAFIPADARVMVQMLDGLPSRLDALSVRSIETA